MNFIESLISFLERFWPFVIIDQWERGVFRIFGRVYFQPLPPGLYPFLPWFMSIEQVSVVPNPIGSPLLNITLRDGKTLSYSIMATVQVEDPVAAIVNIDDYKESTIEAITSVVSEKLAEVDANRLEPEKRGRLRADLLRWVNEETLKFGIRVLSLRFTNFALNQKAYRLLTDSALMNVGDWG